MAEEIQVEESKVVLIAVDDSQFASEAFDWYVNTLKKDSDQIVFVHVPESFDFWQTSEATKQELMKDIENRVKRLECKYDDLVRAKGIHNAKFRTKAGKVGEEIVKLADEIEASYILCGSRGLGKIRRTVLGSVSGYITHHAHMPILIYRQGQQE